MSIDTRSLKISFANIINTLTNQKVIWSDQNAPTPSGDYIAMKISDFRKTGGIDYYSKPDANGVFQTQGNREVLLSLTCISENCMDILLNLIDELELPNNSNLLFKNKIAYVNIESGVRDVTTEINRSFETRSVVELLFRISKNYSSSSESTIPIITSVGLSGEIKPSGQTETREVDFEVE